MIKIILLQLLKSSTDLTRRLQETCVYLNNGSIELVNFLNCFTKTSVAVDMKDSPNKHVNLDFKQKRIDYQARAWFHDHSL